MCMCAVHGGADRSSRRDLPRKGSDMYAWSCSRTVRARADAPASMCHHARCAHARRWQRMGNKRIPTAPNQLLTGILASIMQSSCLFRRHPADTVACACTCTPLASFADDGLVTGRPKQHVAHARPRDWMDLLHPTAKRLESKKIGTAYNWGAV